MRLDSCTRILRRFFRATFVVLSAFGVAQAQEPDDEGDPPDRAVPGAAQFVGLDKVYVTPGAVHRVRIAKDDPRLAELRSLDAVTRSFDYEAFDLVFLDEGRLGGRQGLERFADVLADDMGLIAFDGVQFDTAVPGDYPRLAATIPPGLREAPCTVSETTLLIVQCAGPIRPEWTAELRSAGARIVSYLPSNAFVVSVGADANERVEGLRKSGFVTWTGPYEPWAKLAPALRVGTVPPEVALDIVVQIVAGSDGTQLAGLLEATFPEFQVLEADEFAFDAAMTIPAWVVSTLAQHSSVFAVEKAPSAKSRYDRRARTTTPNSAEIADASEQSWQDTNATGDSQDGDVLPFDMGAARLAPMTGEDGLSAISDSDSDGLGSMAPWTALDSIAATAAFFPTNRMNPGSLSECESPTDDARTVQYAASNQRNLYILRQGFETQCTMGFLLADGPGGIPVLLGYTLERPWKNNRKNISSIPTGTYEGIVRYDHDDHWRIELNGVPNRTHVQIHIGNQPDESKGCILVGLKVSPAECRLGASRKAYARLKEYFYGSSTPVQSPNVTIRVHIQ